MEMEKDVVTIWIIRYEDARIRSFYGTYKEAVELAEKESQGKEYKIV